jgi:hypothetical protein
LPLVPVIATTGIRGLINCGAEPSGAVARSAPVAVIMFGTAMGLVAMVSSTRASPYANASARPALRQGYATTS